MKRQWKMGSGYEFEQDGDFCTERWDLLKILAGLLYNEKRE